MHTIFEVRPRHLVGHFFWNFEKLISYSFPLGSKTPRSNISAFYDFSFIGLIFVPPSWKKNFSKILVLRERPPPNPYIGVHAGGTGRDKALSRPASRSFLLDPPRGPAPHKKPLSRPASRPAFKRSDPPRVPQSRGKSRCPAKFSSQKLIF